MNVNIMPNWFFYSERFFAFNFIGFSFVMFSCWFPTGFSATFSAFAFFSALPIFFYRLRSITLTLVERIGLLLFCWLSLSLFWSEGVFLDGVEAVMEYRIYFMVPVMTVALAENLETAYRALGAALLGAFIALISSFGLAGDWFQVDGAHLSLANRIYHGFIMAILLLFCLLYARENTGVIRWSFVLIALLTSYNVLNVEVGRTGYLQVMAICFLFAILGFSGYKALLAVLLTLILLGSSYVFLDKFRMRVNSTIENVQNSVNKNDYRSSAGYRFEFYRGAIDIARDQPLLGVGVGDVSSALQEKIRSGSIRVNTDNVHNEFLNMQLAGGLPASVLYIGFTASIAYMGLVMRPRRRPVGEALIGLAAIVFVSSLFNSTMKDFGEKHALVIMLSIILAILSQRSQRSPPIIEGKGLNFRF